MLHSKITHISTASFRLDQVWGLQVRLSLKLIPAGLRLKWMALHHWKTQNTPWPQASCHVLCSCHMGIVSLSATRGIQSDFSHWPPVISSFCCSFCSLQLLLGQRAVDCPAELSGGSSISNYDCCQTHPGCYSYSRTTPKKDTCNISCSERTYVQHGAWSSCKQVASSCLASATWATSVKKSFEYI